MTKYTTVSGIVELKEAILDKFQRDNSLSYDPGQVIVSCGAKHTIYNILQAICNSGDEVIFAAPYWVSYIEMVKLADATPLVLKTTPERNFCLTPSQIESAVTANTKAVIIGSPSNPTGTTYDTHSLRQIGELAVKNQFYLISDEIYREFVYDGGFVSPATYNEKTIVIDGFSKSYAMTGWRLGFGVMNADLAAAVAQLQTNSTSCTAAFIQMAGIEALNGPQDAAAAFLTEFKRRRNVIVDGLNSINGISCQKPAGAFYVFPQLSGFPIDTDTIANRLLDEAGVAVLSGSAFGQVGANSLRLSFANSIENLETAVDRMRTFLENLR